jgi:hypothetical protein
MVGRGGGTTVAPRVGRLRCARQRGTTHRHRRSRPTGALWSGDRRIRLPAPERRTHRDARRHDRPRTGTRGALFRGAGRLDRRHSDAGRRCIPRAGLHAVERRGHRCGRLRGGDGRVPPHPAQTAARPAAERAAGVVRRHGLPRPPEPAERRHRSGRTRPGRAGERAPRRGSGGPRADGGDDRRPAHVGTGGRRSERDDIDRSISRRSSGPAGGTSTPPGRGSTSTPRNR